MIKFIKSQPKRHNKLSDYLPWACFVAPGVIWQKDGLLQKTIAFRGPDLDAASAETINGLSWQLNDAIKRYGTGWGFHFEFQKYKTAFYPGSRFTNRAAYLVDEERRLAFVRSGEHFDSCCYLTTWYKLPEANLEKAKSFFYSASGGETSISEEVDRFVGNVSDLKGIMSSRMLVDELDDDMTLSYLHTSVSMDWHKLRAPGALEYIDCILPDSKVEVGSTLKLGDFYIPILTINDFPTETYPGILDTLNKARLEFRWVTRYINMGKEEALSAIGKYQAAYFGKRKTFLQVAGEAATKEPGSGRINQGAMALEADANEAQIEVTNDTVGYGYYTSSVMVWDTDYKKAIEKATEIKRVVQTNGFVCFHDEFNALEAWFGMMPGNAMANRRRPLVSTGNLSHVIPLTAIWSGDKENSFLSETIGDGTPHMVCSTKFATPFYLNLNVGDVMHTFIAGPSGAGKSVLLGTLAIQFLRYENARVIIFDKDRSARQLTRAVGGDYYEPGTGHIAFQPLAELESEEDIIWASEFIELLLSLQGITVNAEKRKSILDALNILKTVGGHQRTISSYQQYVQDEEIKEALILYTLEGPYGTIFDHDENTIRKNNWIMIECDPLMQLGKAAIMPALMFLFHQVDRMFDGNPTMLILDEAWLFLQHPIFQKQMQNWLKTLRKKRVAVVFATQEIADAAKSDIMATILQQCHTKIYLPDEEAVSPAMYDLYKMFGLSDGEIGVIARGKKKSDYFYKSSKGVRQFQLDLGPLALALITGPNNELLDHIEETEDPLMAILKDKGYEELAKKMLEHSPELDTRIGEGE